MDDIRTDRQEFLAERQAEREALTATQQTWRWIYMLSEDRFDYAVAYFTWWLEGGREPDPSQFNLAADIANAIRNGIRRRRPAPGARP